MQNAVISFPALGIELNPPVSLKIIGLNLYLYGMIIACGFLLAIFYCSRRAEELGTTSDDLMDVLLFAVPAGIIGARLYYVIFNYAEFAGDFWSIFKIWQGGIAIYGGVIGAVAAVFTVCRVKKIKTAPMLDVGAFGLLIGQSVGRWGNFVNREVYGVETDFFLRMGLTNPGTDTIYVHPLFLYESLWNALGILILHICSKKMPGYFQGQLFLMYIAWYGVGRMFLEGLRVNQYSLYLLNTGIRVSQLLAAISAGAAVLLIIYLKTKRRTS